ncbi:MAG: peptidoglycan DD-metalloendopeptidase family protein [Rhodocyclaceae bacterium]|nr:peptidoglycan DD-metalloendopeptidase family protein [Rhodocyclaceae bacterium]
MIAKRRRPAAAAAGRHSALRPPGRRVGATLLWALMSFCPQIVVADEIERSRAEREAVQERIEALQRALGSDETRQQEIEREVAKTGRALSAAGRQLRDTRAQLESVGRELKRFEAEQQTLNERIAQRRTRLGEWLRDYYERGGDARLADFLASRSPNQVARDSVYLQRIGAANLSLIDAQREDVAALAEVAGRIEDQRTRLTDVEAKQEQARRALARARAEYRRQSAALEARVKEQKREVAGLKLDEQRLGKLIDGLERIAAERARRAEAARTESPEAVEPKAGNAGPPSREPVVAMLDRQVGSTPNGVAFSKLRGKLGAPVAGAMVGRFGEPRVDGGALWKGVFIRADEGAEVRAVAPGEVVFADWLRGFGNLVIIDHGDAYLTIYGNNDIVVVSVGQRVVGGEPIAGVGVDGGTGESGLYFEIRHRGEPVDPLGWVRR